MKTRTITLIIVLMCFSLIGIIGVQAYWVHQAWQAREAQFDRSVNEAMARVVNQLEEKETEEIVRRHLQLRPVTEFVQEPVEKRMVLPKKQKPKPVKKTVAKTEEKVTDPAKVVFQVATNPSVLSGQEAFFRFQDLDSLRFVKIFKGSQVNFPPDSLWSPVRINADSILKKLRHNRLEVINLSQTQTLDSIFNRKNNRILTTGFTYLTDTLHRSKQPVVPLKKPALPAVKEEKNIIHRKQEQAEKVMKKMVVEMVKKDLPLEKRLNVKQVDSLLHASLSAQGIALPFSFFIADNALNPLLPGKQKQPLINPKTSFYQASLFPNELVKQPENLIVQFPDKQQYVFSSLASMLGVSSLFTLIIMGTFGATLHFIFRQKKISDIKSDFINNMTHEFKTPIATIALATDAINSPKVTSNQERVGYFTGIIQQENKRMLQQVENVLQMALLDRQEIKLNLETVNVHQLLELTIAKLKLQLDNRQAELKCVFPAKDLLVKADKFHLENALLNLLDNALKYSPENPDIKVMLQAKKDQVIVQISDQGIGMTAEEQQRIFDKFYRVPTGNLHDVKGFGLGLSYVKNIIGLHAGQVNVKSFLGKGSTFEITLPALKTV